MIDRAATAALGLLAVAVCAASTLGQQAESQQASSTYRRIFVPQGDLESQIKGLLPLKRDELERRLSALRGGQADKSGIRISRAQYSARLSDQQLVSGEALWEIATSNGASGALSLEPCNLAWGQAHWEESPPRRATLGIGSQNILSLLVDRPGAVKVPWTRRGEKTPDGATQFELVLPPAALQSLRLRVPAGLHLTSEPGLAVRKGELAAGGDAEWQIELGGMSRVKITISDPAQFKSSGNLVLIKEQCRYALTNTDLTADFLYQMDVHGEPLKSARIQVDSRLKVTGVSIGSQAMPWSIAGGDRFRTLSVEFPEPLAGSNYGVSIQAVSPFMADKPFRLPRADWEGAVWQEGECTLSVPASMQVAVTDAVSCRATTGAPASLGESLGFQYHAADGYVEIVASPRKPRLSSAVGVTAQFDATQVSATLRADVASQEGESFTVDAVVSNAWILDSLETVPPELLEDRAVIVQDEQTRTMRLKFQRPITPQRPMKLLVRARLQQRLPADLSSESLWRWFRLKDTIERPAVLALRNNISNYDLQVARDVNAVRLDPEASSSDELSLLDSPPSGLLFRLPPEASDFQILLRQGEPRYSAATELNCACSKGRIRQEVAVRCTPSGPGLSRLKIRGTPPPDREIRWRVTGSSDASIVAQTRRDTGPSQRNPLAEAIWELEFNRPLVQPFTLETAWDAPRGSNQPVVLFACMEATSQSGLVRVAAEDDSRWSLADHGLTPLPISPESDNRYSPVRGIFRYQPGRQASLSIVQSSEDQLLPLACIQDAELTTRFGADASALNNLTLELESTGMPDLAMYLPSGATFQEVDVDGRPLDPLMGASQPGQLRIPLPVGKRHVRVRLSYATGPQTQPFYVRTWRCELPEVALAVPPVRWHVELPPGIRAVAEDRDSGWMEQIPARFWGTALIDAAWTDWIHPWGRDEGQLARVADGNFAGDGPAVTEAQRIIIPGWKRLSQRRVWSPSLTLEVYEPSRIALYSLTLALASAGAVLTVLWRWRFSWVLFGTALAIATLTVPLVDAPLVAGAFWGFIVGSMALLLKPLTMTSDSGQASPATTARWIAASTSATLLLAGLSVAAIERVAAAPPEANGKRAGGGASHRIVIPMDDDGKPTGDYVYVDEVLYSLLFEPARSGIPSESWQLQGATYEVRWPELETGRTAAADVRAQLDIETFAPHAEVRFPFRRGQVLLQQQGVQLDGFPLAVAWQEGESGLSAVVPEPGRHRIDLTFSTPLTVGEDRKELALAIPRAPRATAHFTLPAGVSPSSSPASLGAQNDALTSPAPTWDVELGAAELLSLQVDLPNATAASPEMVEAEGLSWWKVRPGSVVAEAAFKFRPLSGPLRKAQLRFDPQLRLISLSGLPSGSRHWIEPGSPSTLQLEFSEPINDEILVRSRFLLAEASGIGKLILPRVEPVATRVARSWMALTVGPGLELTTVDQASAPIPPSDFAQAAKIAGSAPQAAFDLLGTSAAFELECRPEMRQPTANSETTIYCGSRLCRLRFFVELTDLTPDQLQQRVVLPPGWSATNVSVRDSDLPVRSRWFQGPDGIVVVRLEQPPGTSQQLQIEATMSPDIGEKFVLPASQVLGARDAGHSLKVIRSYDCTVNVADLVGWSLDDLGTIDRPQEGMGRLVTVLRGPAGEARRQVTMQIFVNRPQVSMRLVTRYVRTSSSGAEAIALCLLDISEGKLDALRLEGPPEWSGPFETSPPLSVNSVVVPGQARRRMTLLPEKPLSGRVQILIRAPLRPTAGEPLRVPDIVPIDAVQVERYVQLPKVVEGDATKWDVSGLQAVPLPAELQVAPLAGDDFETLAVRAPHFDAVLTVAGAPRDEPLASLVEYRVAWHEAGILSGNATFSLDIGRLETCLIQFPPQLEPKFATLDGSPAVITPDVGGKWRLRLPLDRFPKRLSVFYSGACQPKSGQLLLVGPTLVGVQARATLWSLECPSSLAWTESVLSDESESVRLDQDLVRLASVEEILKRVRERETTGFSRSDLTAWLRPWQVETATAAKRARTAIRTLVNDNDSRESKFDQLQARLNEHWRTLLGEPSSDAQRDSIADSDVHSGDTRRYGGAFGGQRSQVAMTFDDRNANAPLKRNALVVLVLLVGIGSWVLLRSKLAGDWLAASGPFVLAATGVVLTCISPLGMAALAIVLAGLSFSIWPTWTKRSREHHPRSAAILRPARRAI